MGSLPPGVRDGIHVFRVWSAAGRPGLHTVLGVKHGAMLDQLSRCCSPQLKARPAGMGQMRTLTLLQFTATWVPLSDLGALALFCQDHCSKVRSMLRSFSAEPHCANSSLVFPPIIGRVTVLSSRSAYKGIHQFEQAKLPCSHVYTPRSQTPHCFGSGSTPSSV